MIPDNPDEAWEPEGPPRSPAESPETYRLMGGVTGADAVIGIPQPTVLKPAGREDDAVRRSTSRGPVSRRSAAGRALVWGLNLLVFVTSVAVMVLELTASRLIAKHVGSSLYTWTSVIGVVLAGITLGNFLGGWVSDRFATNRARSLSWLLLLASLACGLVLWLDPLMMNLERPDGVSWPLWIVIIVAAIFFVPSLLLGTISPIAASLALANSQRTGTTVGNIYAWGAAGSIVGTFLTGFFLVDLFGTRAIIGLTALTLAVEAICVAAGRWGFRAFVVFGWLQMLAFWSLAAVLTAETGAAFAARVGTSASVFSTPRDAENQVADWKTFGNQFGTKLHELGLILKLRDDKPGQYVDESNYSYIEVGDTYEEDEPIKYLRLDKLVHSYFDPNDPTRLYYDYERIYAAVTRRAFGEQQGAVSVILEPFPDADSLLGTLPEGATYDEATRTLRLEERSTELIDAIARLSPEWSWWQALEALRTETQRTKWGGFSTAPLTALPEGVAIPADLAGAIRFDESLSVLKAYERLDDEKIDRLIALGRHAPLRLGLNRLGQSTRAINSYFLGGGGFIFPRWVLAQYPASKTVDVAELDPSVLHAVVTNFPFQETERQRIVTRIGDARLDVMDRVRENRRRTAAGESPVLYDVIYGDAFNDFSIPWHLTTREFNGMVAELLNDDGVFQANVIEMYPRTVVPSDPGGMREVECAGRVPPELLGGSTRQDAWLTVPKSFGPLQVFPRSNATSALRWSGAMSDDQAAALRKLTDSQSWHDAVERLNAATQRPRLAQIAIPQALLPGQLPDESWTPADGEFAAVELWKHEQGFAVGVRGEMSDELAGRLRELSPNDTAWVKLVDELRDQSRRVRAGRFLGRYVRTLADVFPCVYVFSTWGRVPGTDRDTYVAVCTKRPLDLNNLPDVEGLGDSPFAICERPSKSETATLNPHFLSLMSLSEGHLLTDDFAPVENLLLPVFADQE